MKRLLIYFAFSILFILESHSQEISSNSFNRKLLEQLIKTKIDSVRNKNKKGDLLNDSILYLAANHHANYLLENNTLSHTEKNGKQKTPQARAEFFGAKNYLVGENVAFTYMKVNVKDKKGKFHINKTYEDLANDFVDMWIHSQGHFNNIVHSDYTLTAVAIAFNEKTNKVYAVQNFAWISKK